MKRLKQEVSKRPVPYIPLLIGIIIFAGVLRFWNLGFNSLWLDEAATFANINTASITTVLTNVYIDHHAPLYFIVVWFVHFISSTEFWLRVPSMVAGIATIPVIYFLGKEVANEKVGLFAALLLALSPYHIYYSQEARMYTFTTLFITLAYYLFFKASHTDNGRYWILMWMSCTAAFYTHFYTGFVTIPLIGGYFVIRGTDTKDLEWFLGGGVGAFLLILPILHSFFNQSGYLLEVAATWGLHAFTIPVYTLTSFSFQNQIVASIFLLLAVLGMWLIYKKDSAISMTVGIFLLVPLLVSMVMSRYIPFNIRYHIYLLPLFLVVVSIAIDRLTRIWKNRNGLYAAVSLIFVCAVIILPPYYSQYTKEDWRGFSNQLSRSTNPGDTVVVVPSYMQLPLNYYYSNSTDGTIQRGASSVTDLQSITAEKRTFYIVTGDINAQDTSGNSVVWLQQNTRPIAEYTRIYLFVRNP